MRNATVLVTLLLLAGCAATPVIDLKEPRRLLGTESDVRLDAEIRTDTLSTSQQLPFDYIVTNNRPTAIAVAELIPEATYDPDSRVVTVTIGTEVPGEELLPRLVVIPPGQKKQFAGAARVSIPMRVGSTEHFERIPNGIQLKLNFLGDPKQFEPLIGISERVVHDPKLANELFPKWVEDNETLFTNVLPMKWGAASVSGMMDASQGGDTSGAGTAARRRRRP